MIKWRITKGNITNTHIRRLKILIVNNILLPQSGSALAAQNLCQPKTMITQIASDSFQQSQFPLIIFRYLLVFTGCITSLSSYSLAKDMKILCEDTHSLFVQNGVKKSRPAEAKYFVQVDGDLVLEKYEGFPNIYASKVVWRKDGYIVAVQRDKIGGSGITTMSIAIKGSAPVLATRMHVDAISGTTSSFFSRCKKMSR